jgi:hypothetical protein
VRGVEALRDQWDVRYQVQTSTVGKAMLEDGAISGILNIIHDLIAIIFMSGNFYVRPSPHFFKGCGKQI